MRPDGLQWSRADVDQIGTLVILRRNLGSSSAAATAAEVAAAVAAEEESFLLEYNTTSADAASQEALMKVCMLFCRKKHLALELCPKNLLQEFCGLKSPATQIALGGPSVASPSFPAYEGFDGTIYDMHGNELADVTINEADRSPDVVAVRCPHAPTACRMASLIRAVKAAQDSTGGVLTTTVSRVPVGLGEPCFDKLQALLAHAMLSLPAVKGFELGSGFYGTQTRGSVHNDAFVPVAPCENRDGGQASSSGGGCAAVPSDPLLRTATNHAGGTLGGISNGAPLQFRVAIKPVSTIGRPQATAAYDGSPTILEAKGRHDPCVLPRAPPLVEAMTALVLADTALIQRSRGLPMRCLDAVEEESSY
jgi:chorismate synthase